MQGTTAARRDRLSSGEALPRLRHHRHYHLQHLGEPGHQLRTAQHHDLVYPPQSGKGRLQHQARIPRRLPTGAVVSYRAVVIDFETLFGEIAPPPGNPHLDSNYSLSVMNTESYVRDPRFAAHGAAIKWSPDEPAQWYEERRLRQVLKDEDWSDVYLIAHHMQFDGFILSHHYQVVPKMYGCTLAMGRLLLGNHISVSLDSVRKQFGLPQKLTPYHLFRGKRWNEIDPNSQRLIGEGAADEVESIFVIFKKMLSGDY